LFCLWVAAADVSAWEAEIDRLAYALYGLSPAGMITEEEIAVVEGVKPRRACGGL